MRFPDICDLLQQAFLSMFPELAAGPFGRLQVFPVLLGKSCVQCIVFPVPVFRNNQGFRGFDGRMSQPVLSGLQENIVPVFLPAGSMNGDRHFTAGSFQYPVYEIFTHPRFIQGYFPGQYTRVVTVPAYHIPRCFYDLCLKSRVVRKILPAGDSIQHKQSQPVTGFHEIGGLRIMRQTYQVKTGFLDLYGIPPLRVPRYRITYIRILLVAVYPT